MHNKKCSFFATAESGFGQEFSIFVGILWSLP
jgi:hypothetical protein